MAIDELRIDYAGAVGLFGRHAPVRAVERASLTVAAGRSLALVGESGSGKTSIARAVLRLIRPSSGRILFRGEDIAGLSGAQLRAYRQAVRVVFQNPATSLNPAHTVEALVGRTLALAGVDAATIRASVSAILAAVGLDDGYRRRRPADLSGGERQRVALARAFLGEPALVVLDEPTSSLDVLVHAQVLRLLAELRARSGAAYLLISHDLAVVRQLADDVVVMREGRIVESGPVAEVIDRPRADYTKALLAAVA